MDSSECLASLSIPPELQGPNILDIPVVDMGEPEMAKLVEAVAGASREWGICQLVNHGIPSDLIQRFQTAGKEFFQLPQEEKDKYKKPPEIPGLNGYGSFIGGKDPDDKKLWSDYLVHKVWPPSAIDYRYWPLNPPSYREVNEEYASYVRQVVDKLFRALSLGLGLPENSLKVGVGGEDMDYELRINFYPPSPEPDQALGLFAHTDLGSMTIIVPNDVPGLQVMKDDRWFDAKYIPNALVFIIGDQIEILSNGAYKSVLHRTTVNKEKARMSWPVFMRPPPDLVVGPLLEIVGHQNPTKFQTKKFKDYMFCKINKIGELLPPSHHQGEDHDLDIIK